MKCTRKVGHNKKSAFYAKKVRFCNHYDENFKKAVILDVTENKLTYHEIVCKHWNVFTREELIAENRCLFVENLVAKN